MGGGLMGIFRPLLFLFASVSFVGFLRASKSSIAFLMILAWCQLPLSIN